MIILHIVISWTLIWCYNCHFLNLMWSYCIYFSLLMFLWNVRVVYLIHVCMCFICLATNWASRDMRRTRSQGRRQRRGGEDREGWEGRRRWRRRRVWGRWRGCWRAAADWGWGGNCCIPAGWWAFASGPAAETTGWMVASGTVQVSSFSFLVYDWVWLYCVLWLCCPMRRNKVIYYTSSLSVWLCIFSKHLAAKLWSNRLI